MIKMYGMDTCIDCQVLKKQIEKRNDIKYINIGQHVHLLKEFIQIRDNNQLFDEIKKEGKLGIPCFILEDGSITLSPEDIGLVSSGEACSIEDHKNGKIGC